MRGALRRGSLLGRWGGEEFLALVDARDEADARAVAERLRTAVGQRPFAYAGDAFAVTASIGVAPWADDEAFAHAVANADGALYEAKRGGRDRVVAAADAVTRPAAEARGTP
jgi:diguanylate cyclase (GGDEF)-like protein